MRISKEVRLRGKVRLWGNVVMLKGRVKRECQVEIRE